MPFVPLGMKLHWNLIVNACALCMGVFWSRKGQSHFLESLHDSLVSCAHGQ